MRPEPDTLQLPTGAYLGVLFGCEDPDAYRFEHMREFAADSLTSMRTLTARLLPSPDNTTCRTIGQQYKGLMASAMDTLPNATDLFVARIQENLPILRAMGFGLDPFGGRGEFIVDALPSGIETTDCRTLLADIAHGIETAGVRRGSEKWKEKAVAMGAARAAIPQVAQLHPEAMARLVNDLAHTRMPYTSPRGRPTMLFTSLSELARKFNRGGA